MSISVELNEAFSKAETINVYNEGSFTAHYITDNKYGTILSEFLCMIQGAHQMPAFGVSLNNATLNELSKGVWLEFVFDMQYENNGLPFEKLLINVQKNFSGFNIIRYNSQVGYDGRCFYYDLVNNNMDKLFNLLIAE